MANKKKADLLISLIISCCTCVLLLSSCTGGMQRNISDPNMMEDKAKEFQRAPYDARAQDTRPGVYNTVNDLRR